MSGFKPAPMTLTYWADEAWRVRVWVYAPEPAHASDDESIDHHDHNPFWSRSMLLGAYIASGGDL